MSNLTPEQLRELAAKIQAMPAQATGHTLAEVFERETDMSRLTPEEFARAFQRAVKDGNDSSNR